MSYFISKSLWIDKIIQDLLRHSEIDLWNDHDYRIYFSLKSQDIIWFLWNTLIIQALYFVEVFNLLSQCSIFQAEGSHLITKIQSSLSVLISASSSDTLQLWWITHYPNCSVPVTAALLLFGGSIKHLGPV